MNDFTKKELMEIYGCVNSIVAMNAQSKDYFTPLANKIESMIDEYDHEINKDNPMYKCIRCGSKKIDTLFKIKYGLHDWFLCEDCGSQFYEFVIDKKADNGCLWAKTHFKRKYGNNE